jgi:isoquinoline 1-oxidoreductase alpha subunit
MADYTFRINGENRSVEDVPEWLPMLWVLRDKLGITGPKYGCGIGACRACTCHIADGNGGFEEFQPCVTPASEVGDRSIRTIEGLADGNGLHPVQEAWLELDVPQCGFCQPGQIMTATALLANNGGQVTDDDIDQIENVCRCGTYARIRQAIKRAAAQMANNGDDDDFGRSDNSPGNSANTPAADRPTPGNNAGGNGNGNGRGNRPDTPDNPLGDLLGGNDDTDDTPTDTPDDTSNSSGGGLLGGLLGRR